MGGIKVSVVIPAFNIENQIEECLESILTQTLKEVEIIVVNDGSTDNTENVVLDFFSERKNCSFKYYSEENSGAGKARNVGIKNASGEYIAFMDGDDFYHNTTILEKMYEKAKVMDALICGGNISFLRNGIYSVGDGRKGTSIDYEGWITKEELETANSFYRFIYKTSFLNNNKLFFPNYRRNQDNPFFLRCISMAGKIYYIKDETYCYRVGYKNVGWNEKKALGLAEGVRDELEICLESNIKKVFWNRAEELHGNFAGIVYKYALKDAAIEKVMVEINELLQKAGADEQYLLLTGNILREYMNSLEKRKISMLEEIRKFNRRVVFGAGLVGKSVVRLCKEEGIEIEAVVVSNTEQNVDSLIGVPVCSVDKYIKDCKNVLIIESVSSYLRDDVKQILENKGFKQILCVDTELIALTDSEYQEKM